MYDHVSMNSSKGTRGLGLSPDIGYRMFIATLNRVNATERHHTTCDASLDIVSVFGTSAIAFSTLLELK